MTNKQFENHKWKIGETVYVVTYLSFQGARLPYARVVEAKITCITTNTYSDGIEVKCVEVGNVELNKHEYLMNTDIYHRYFPSNNADLIFTTKKSADKYMDRVSANNNFKTRCEPLLCLLKKRVKDAQDELNTFKNYAKNGL